MMGTEVLYKRVSRLAQLVQREGTDVDFDELAACLAEISPGTSVYVINQSGKLLGYAPAGSWDSSSFDAGWLVERHLPAEVNEVLLKVGAISSGPEADRLVGHLAMIVPVVGMGRRVGTLLLVGQSEPFTQEDEILGEFAGTVAGMAIANALDEEEEGEVEERRRARSAIRSLSYSEIVAMQRILDELDGDEGLLVASRIADQAGITRSVIVNALRKLASANVIESRSLGMKGTYLRIINREVRAELERERFPYVHNTNVPVKRRA